MSQPPHQPPVPSDQPAEDTIAAGAPALSAGGPVGRPGSPGEERPASAAGNASLADTTGTGTIVALGCIGGTVFLIVLGLLYLLVTQLFG